MQITESKAASIFKHFNENLRGENIEGKKERS